MRFSQRIGKTPIKTAIQVESIDEALKNRLWNIFMLSFEKLTYFDHASSERSDVCKDFWINFFNYPITNIPLTRWQAVDANHVVEQIRRYYNSASWYEIFDLVEYICTDIRAYPFVRIADRFNEALVKEVSGYRIINNKVVQITSNEEVSSIEEAMNNSDNFKTVNHHLNSSLSMLSDRVAPDYRNSIKEAISAVEAFCKTITGDPKSSLGKALAVIETKHKLHGSLKEAYSKLYGYTSDADGIRHALLEDGVSIEFEDAKFMLVSCSAFINYLKTKLKI